jgi:hypothetical protein
VGPRVACMHGKCVLCWSLCRIRNRASLNLRRTRDTSLSRLDVLVRVGLGNSRLVCDLPVRVYIYVKAESIVTLKVVRQRKRAIKKKFRACDTHAWR